jgi:hypothetical protein
MASHTKMMGAQKARTLVKNHCRTPTISSVFFVRIHVCLRIAMAMGAGARGEGGGWRTLLLCPGRKTRINSSGRQKAGSRIKQQRQYQEAFPRGKREEADAKEQRQQFAMVLSLTGVGAHGVYALPSRSDMLSSPVRRGQVASANQSIRRPLGPRLPKIARQLRLRLRR